MIPASFRNQGVKFVVRVQSGFRVHACSENADVTIWLPIGADVILERPTCEWEGKINALAPRTFPSKGYLTASRAPLMALD